MTDISTTWAGNHLQSQGSDYRSGSRNVSLSKDYPHPDDPAKQITDTPGFKPFTINFLLRLLFLFLFSSTLTNPATDHLKGEDLITNGI